MIVVIFLLSFGLAPATPRLGVGVEDCVTTLHALRTYEGMQIESTTAAADGTFLYTMVESPPKKRGKKKTAIFGCRESI